MSPLRRRRLAFAVAAACTGLLFLTGCGDPCAGLKPSVQDQVAIDNGGEVDRAGKWGTECEASRETGGVFTADD